MCAAWFRAGLLAVDQPASVYFALAFVSLPSSAVLRHSPAAPLACHPAPGIRGSHTRSRRRRRDANNEVIPRDAAAVSVETPRRRVLSHPAVTSRRPIGPGWMLIEGCKRRGRARRGDESSPSRGGGRKAVRSHVCPSAEATFVLLDVVGPVLPRWHGRFFGDTKTTAAADNGNERHTWTWDLFRFFPETVKSQSHEEFRAWTESVRRFLRRQARCPARLSDSTNRFVIAPIYQ